MADPPGTRLKAVKAAAAPVIDGRITDAEWAGAAVATNFVQSEPRRGEPAGVRTEVFVLYDAATIYLAYRAWDPEPVTAQLTQRDADLGGDDAVIVLFDTFHDRRTAYYFMTNALGTQADGRITDDGRSTDGTWDAPWQSAAVRTD